MNRELNISNVEKVVFELDDVSLYYGKTPVVKDINITFVDKNVACIIGPSGSGKSTLLRALNRMNDLIPAFQCKGRVMFNGHDIYNNGIGVNQLRQDVGMVFQKPCIFPKSIYDNVLFGVRHLHSKRRSEFQHIVEETLKSVSLWNEVKDKLHHSALELSQGQQQRLSIARALAVEPKVLLMDEPTSSLDHKSASAIDELVKNLRGQLTVIMVTHKLEQAKKIADDVIFMCDGKICESGQANQLFKEPKMIETRCYIDHES
ncbi:MAG: phosphate ABC transporter ATP-binding protein [Candidatus Anammoxibacter sp.]